jgi:hypothetical protein
MSAAIRLAWLLLLCLLLPAPALAGPGIGFWDRQRKGANYFNTSPDEAWFAAAAELGIEWARLAYDKWQGQGRDFLIRDADAYTGLVPEDLARLRQTLDQAQRQGIKVVIAPLSLPGARWSQNNGDQPDLRLWQDKAYWEQASRFWQDLARALADHPAVAAYNLLNEPIPEKGTGLAEHGDPARYAAWYRQHQGTTRDLPAFYRQLIKAIRAVDSETPIMLDAGWYAQPAAFAYWPGRLDDDRLLYAFHMYEPYDFSNRLNFKRAEPYRYPGPIPYADQTLDWNPAQLQRYLQPYFDWAAAAGIPASRQVAAEFGCYRRNPGCEAYLTDLTRIFNSQGIHWAFYSFREDEWDGYDYELGAGPLPPGYWEAKEAGKPIPRHANPLFEVLRREFKADTR